MKRRYEFHIACKEGNLKDVRELLDCGASINAKSFMSETPLHYAATPEIVRELLDRKADIEAVDYFGATPLFQACGSSFKTDVVRELLDRGANIEANVNGTTPLLRAIQQEAFECVDLLLARGACVNSKDRAGNAALHCACIDYDDVQVVDDLLDRGADINASNNGGQTPLALAIENRWFSLVSPLLLRGASVNVVARAGWTPLHYVDDVATACALLDAGADIDSRTNSGETALEMVCSRLDRELAALYLSRNASFADLEHLIDKARETELEEEDDVEDFVKFLEDYVASMHPVMK